MKWSRARLVVALASFASFAPVPATRESAARPPQDVIVIGTLGGLNRALWAVNDRGQAVGWSDVTTTDSEHAILWEDGRIVDLGLMPGDGVSRAFGVNDRGQVVGISVNHDRGEAQAVLWQDGQMIPLGVGCRAEDINDRGEIAGACSGRPRVWRDGEIVSIGLLPGAVGAGGTAINDKGAVVGPTVDAAGRQSGYLWEDGQLIDLGASGVAMRPNDVNDRRQVVGTTVTTVVDGVEPVIWEDGQVKPLSGTWGSFHGVAWGINDHGEVVGRGHDASHVPGGFDGAFVWAKGEFRPLPNAGTPRKISNHGVAVGIGIDPVGFSLGIIWPRAVTRPQRGPS